jgi:hypothetical protein
MRKQLGRWQGKLLLDYNILTYKMLLESNDPQREKGSMGWSNSFDQEGYDHTDGLPRKME